MLTNRSLALALVGTLAFGCGLGDKVGGNQGDDGGDAPDSGADSSSGGDDAGQSEHMAAEPDCDLNGFWIGKQVAANTAAGITTAFSNSYYFLQIAQDGHDVEVVDHFNCSVVVLGAVMVVLQRETTEAFIEHNSQRGRKGTMQKSGDSCEFRMDRFWSARGVDEEAFVPSPSNRVVPISQLRAELPLPTEVTSDVQDWDGDGNPGLTWTINGDGYRYSVQRDWIEWFTDATHPITPAADWDMLTVRADYEVEENVFDASNPLYKLVATPEPGAEHELQLKFLGRTSADPRYAEVVKATRFETCREVQRLMPPQNRLP